MKTSYIKSILNNLDRLVITNGQLAESHSKALSMISRSESEKDQLLATCKEIYQTLADKKKRSLAEESWYIGLHKVLNKSS